MCVCIYKDVHIYVLRKISMSFMKKILRLKLRVGGGK